MILKLNSDSFSLLDKLLWGMSFIWLIVDSITGYFISFGGNMPLSQIFKLLLLIFIVIRLARIRFCFKLFFFVLLYISWYFLYLTLIDADLVAPILLLSKFLTVIFFYVYFRYLVSKNPIQTIANTQKTIVIAWFVVACNVILGLMGYGVGTYGDEEEIDMGVKGFFYAGNELGGVMAVLSPFMVYWVRNRWTGLKLMIVLLIIAGIGIVIGTKTSILVTLLAVIGIPYLYSSPAKRVRFVIIFLVILLFASLYLIDFILESDIALVDRWTYFYDIGGTTKLFFSGRDDFWNEKKDLFFNSNIFTQLFGIGLEGKMVERDHLDFLLTFGYLGLVAVVSFYLYLLIIAIKNRHNNPLSKVIIFSDILILGIGYLAGHVWYSAMASVYIALLNALVFVPCKKTSFSSSINCKI